MEFKKLVINSQRDLNILSSKKNYIITKAKYGPSKETKIPLNIDKDLAFFTAAIIGDGHLKKSKKQISIELSNKKLLEYLRKICITSFNRTFNICSIKQREGKKPSWHMSIDSKSIHNFLNQALEIPIGKKSHKVIIPKIIKKADKETKKAFLQGIMATEGGKRRRGYGLSTASKKLWEELILLFEELNIPTQKDKWIYKKYKKEYYGLTFKKDCYNYLMRRCRSGQTGCV